MDETTQEHLKKALQALKTLQKSTERSLQMDMYQGTRKLVTRSYENLHQRIRELVPDDAFIESMTLDYNSNTEEREILTQVQFATHQLHTYLKDQIRQESEATWSFGDYGEFTLEAERFKNLGREIQEQVMGVTRHTLRRALSNFDFDFTTDSDFRRSRIEGKDLQGKNLSGADFRSAVVLNCNLSGANLSGADLRKVYFDNSNLTGANVDGGDNRKIIANQCDLTGANFHRADLRRAVFYDSNLQGINLSRATMRGVQIVNCDMSGANLTRADVSDVTFYNVNLEGAMMPDGRPYQSGMDLRQYGIVHGSGPVPPVPPIPPMPPQPEKRKRGVRIEIGDADDEIDAEMEELEEEMDALEVEIDELDVEMEDLGAETIRKQEKLRDELDQRRRELEERRRQIEAELDALDDEYEE
jgi:uncharacterized protein YjbI with pentapeptide repeats